MKKLSIILVTYNAEKVIERTILSIKPWVSEQVELVIKDGGSSDRTLNIANSYSDVIAFVKSCPDVGVYDGMNQAVEYTSGEYLMFINAGDELIKLDVSTLNDSSTCFYWDEARDIIKRDIASRFFLTRNTPCHQSVIYKKSDFVKYNLDYGLAADFEQIVRIVKYRGIAFSTNSSIVKYANPGLSSQYYKPTFKQLLEQLGQRFKTISENYGIIERFLCIVFSVKTIVLKLIKEAR